MPQFIFTVKDNSGSTSSGRIEATDNTAALRSLTQKDLIVTKLTEIKSHKERLKVNGDDLLLFTREMSSMLKAGIKLTRVLNIIASDIDSPSMRQISMELDTGLKEGHELSDLLINYPRVFSKFYISMVKAGESSGNLPTTLNRLSDYIEQTETLKRKIKSQMYYPSLVITFSVAVVILIFSIGLPVVSEIYKGSNVPLPVITLLLLSIGNFFKDYWLLFILGLSLLTLILLRYLKTEEGKIRLDTLKFNLPILGGIVKRLAIARFARTLSTLYGAGVPIIQAIHLVIGSIGNAMMEKELTNTASRLNKGDSITQAISNVDVQIFTPMAISMVAAGEETGSLTDMLDELAQFYETQVEITIKTLTELLEPIMMIAVGIMVAIIILGLALPFMQIFTILG